MQHHSGWHSPFTGLLEIQDDPPRWVSCARWSFPWLLIRYFGHQGETQASIGGLGSWSNHMCDRKLSSCLHQLDIRTPWCAHQTRIASRATSMVSLLRQSDAIVLHQQWLAVLVLKPCRLRAAVILGFGNRVDQKVDPQLLGHIHSPMLWPPVDYHLRLAGLLEETACVSPDPQTRTCALYSSKKCGARCWSQARWPQKVMSCFHETSDPILSRILC